MTGQQNKQFDLAITYTIELHEILKRIKTRDHTGEWLQFLYLPHKMNDEQKQARELMDKITQIILNQNRQISKKIIHERVIYNLLQLAIWYYKDYPDFPSTAKEEMKILFEYSSYRDIDIPLVYLATENSPTQFGVITIHSLLEEDRKHKWWDKVLASGGKDYSVFSYARVKAPGDLQISIENAKKITNDMLNYLRAIGFPIALNYQNQFGLLNEYSNLLLPFRIGIPNENYKLEAQVSLSTSFSSLKRYEIQEDLLDKIPSEILLKLQDLIETDYFSPSTEMKRKFFLGLHWLGEATKPDTKESCFVKLFFSFEGLIGGQIKDSRETKKILAKRCSILISGSKNEQEKHYNSVIEYYKIRSQIVHGGKEGVSEIALIEFSEIVRKTAWALLGKLNKHETIISLHNELFESV